MTNCQSDKLPRLGHAGLLGAAGRLLASVACRAGWSDHAPAPASVACCSLRLFASMVQGDRPERALSLARQLHTRAAQEGAVKLAAHLKHVTGRGVVDWSLVWWKECLGEPVAGNARQRQGTGRPLAWQHVLDLGTEARSEMVASQGQALSLLPSHLIPAH